MSEETTEQYQAKWNEYQLGQLASLAQQHIFYIPRFQRDFVWNEGQIKLLADSIARNYPIGSLLLLAENRSTIQLAGRPISALLQAEETGHETTTADDTQTRLNRFHVLDGQQRLTSLVRVFANLSPKRIYYVDLIRVLESFGPDSTEESDWLISRSRPKDPKATKDRGRLIRADAILDAKKTSLYLDEFFDEILPDTLPVQFQNGDAAIRKAKQREAKATIVQVFETIRNYRVPSIVIERESPLSAICRIFETINSTGRRLTTFDLAVASFYPSPDLRSLWEQSVEKYPRIAKFNLDGERVLQLLVLLKSDADHANFTTSRNAILGLTAHREYVQNKWFHACDALERALEWAESLGAHGSSLPHEPIVISVACFFGTPDADVWLKRSAGAFSQLERWYFSKILQPGSKAASNYSIARDFQELLAWFRDEKSLPSPQVSLSAETVATLAPSDVRYKAIFSLLVRRVANDLRTQATLGSEAIEDHHIYPRSFQKRHHLDLRKLDGIANRIPVSFSTNRSIHDRAPQEYFLEILRETRPKAVAELLADAGFESFSSNDEFVSSLSVDNFEKFVAARAVRILNMLQTILNGLLLRTTTTDED